MTDLAGSWVPPSAAKGGGPDVSEDLYAPGGPPELAGFRDLLRVLAPYRRSLLIALVLGLLATGTAAVQPLVVSAIVDAFSAGIPVRLVVLMGALLLCSGGLAAVRQLVMQRAGERFAFDTRERVVRHLYSLPMSELERRDRGDLVSRVSADVTQSRDILTSGLVDLASDAVTVLVSLAMMAVIDSVLLGLSVVVVGIILVCLVVIARRTGPAGLRHQEAIGELAASVSRALGAMKTIRATRSAPAEIGASVGYARRAMGAGLSVAGLKAVVDAFSGISVQVLLIAVIGTGALRVAAGSLSTGQLSAFIMYLLLMAGPLAMVGGVVSMLGEAMGALSRIRELEAIPAERDVERPGTASVPRAGDPGCVFEFQDVYFSYPDRVSAGGWLPSALNGVCLRIEGGTTTAIVGPSGAGKSTLIALLERFYEPSSGRILFHGRDVQELSRDLLRAQISYVDQDSVALSGTVRANLLLGAPDVTDHECAEALVRVGLAGDLEAGLALMDHEVGEVGGKLSGGERQRLAIARAFLADSPVFLLDEITSNLDSRNEALVQELLLGPATRRTVVIVAHRFSTVVNADTIVVMDGGRVSATGAHHELLRTSSLYRELAEHQLAPPAPGEARRGRS